MRCPHRDHKGRQCVRSAHLLYGAHVYGNIPKVGAKRIRETVALGIFREEVAARVWCEAQGEIRPEGGFVCWDRQHVGDDAHHLEPNDRDIGLHDPDRAIFVCRAAHDWIHANPDAARVLGLLRPFRESMPEGPGAA